MQGDMIGDYLLANYDAYDLNGDGVISYVMFKGQEDNQEAIARAPSMARRTPMPSWLPPASPPSSSTTRAMPRSTSWTRPAPGAVRLRRTT